MRKIIFVIMVILLSSVMIVTSYGVTDIPTGDINGDGRITAADARLALRAAASLDLLADTAFVAADVNQDGKVTAADARAILRKAAGLDESDKEAVPADFDRMSDLLADMIDVEFDYETADTAYVVDHIIHDYLFIVTYYNYFNDAESDGCDYTDPLGKLMFYYKVPAENVRWICENIYQVEFDENYVSAEGKSYCYDGYVYIEFAQAGYGCDFRTEIDEYKVLDDGKYEIVASSYSGGFEDFGIPDELMYRLKVIAEWKLVDGKYDWVFYSVKKFSSPDFERMENLLNNTHCAEFDCETADTAYVVDDIIHAGICIPTYNSYFGSETYQAFDEGNQIIDPLNKFIAGSFNGIYYAHYFKVPAENIKWICENIYQTEFDENYTSNTGESYYYDGYVYIYYPQMGGLLHEASIDRYQLLSDGKYEITVQYYVCHQPDEDLVYDKTLKVIAEWKQIDGKYDWVFYSVEHIVTPDFDRVEEILLWTLGQPFDYRHNDAEYVVENILYFEEVWPFGYKMYSDETLVFYDTCWGNDSPDPYGRFDYYFILDAQTVKWICEEIYHVECNETEYNSDNSYFYNGKLYLGCPGYAGLDGGLRVEIESYAINPNGSYEIIVNRYYENDILGTYSIVAEWTEVDGQYQWTFYSINVIS